MNLTCYVLLQFEEVRLRQNVDVTVSLESDPAPRPIESFTDMVQLCVLNFNYGFEIILNIWFITSVI